MNPSIKESFYLTIVPTICCQHTTSDSNMIVSFNQDQAQALNPAISLNYPLTIKEKQGILFLQKLSTPIFVEGNCGSAIIQKTLLDTVSQATSKLIQSMFQNTPSIPAWILSNTLNLQTEVQTLKRMENLL